MKPIPPPAGEEVGPKLVRIAYFVGAGVLCTAAINKWKDFEKKSTIQKQKKMDEDESSVERQPNAVHKAVE